MGTVIGFLVLMLVAEIFMAGAGVPGPVMAFFLWRYKRRLEREKEESWRRKR